jgi:hypothetical protein
MSLSPCAAACFARIKFRMRLSNSSPPTSLSPLLAICNDAVDALQIHPPAPEIALERVMIALSSIEKAAR